jgi:hypothetical protein
MKRSSELATTRKFETRQKLLALQAQCRSPKPVLQQKYASAIEKLPPELIEQIFLSCLEVNLAKASPWLGKILAKESVYRILILFAFSKDAGHSTARTTPFPNEDPDEFMLDVSYRTSLFAIATELFRPAVYRRLGDDERTRLQWQILPCRWCTITRIHRYHKELTLLDDAAPAQLLGVVLGVESSSSIPATTSPPFYKVELFKMWHIMVHENDFFFRSRPMPNYCETVFTEFQFPTVSHFHLKPQSPKQFWHNSQETMVYSNAINITCIPDCFLQGCPWTDRKLATLWVLRQGWEPFGRMEKLQLSAASLFEGINSAIVEHNIDALRLLLEIHWLACVYTHEPPSGELLEDLQSVDPLFSMQPWPFDHPIPLWIFHLAAQQGDYSTEMLSMLAAEDASSLVADDLILTKWAVHQDPKNNFSQRLLAFMAGLTRWKAERP